MATISELEATIPPTQDRVDDLTARLGWHDRNRARLALRAALHLLRDQLPLEEAVCPGADLPVLLRGAYYEGWHPYEHRSGGVDRDELLARLHASLHHDPAIDPEEVARAVMSQLADRLPEAEREDILSAVPAGPRGLWPT